MKLKYLIQLSALLALLAGSLGSNLSAKAAPASETIINHDLTVWNATYVGYVDVTRSEKWQFNLAQTYTFTASAVTASGDLIPLVSLLDQNGNEISTQTGSLTSTQPAGIYFIFVKPVSGSGTYLLTLRQINTSTATPTSTPTRTPTSTQIFTSTFTPTFTPTSTRTATPTAAASLTATPTFTSTPTSTNAASLTPTRTPTPGTPSATPVTATTTATATPTATRTATAISTLPNVTITINPASINIGGTSDGTVNLNNPPVSGYASAEFTCTYNQTLIQISNFVAGSVFGPNPVMVVNGPAGGTFIVAIAGSNGSEATASGIAFTFDILALQSGTATVQCTVRVSDGSDTLVPIPSTPANVTVTNPQGNLAGQVLASKPVTVSLFNPSPAASVVANPDGTFNLSAPAGAYTVIASAEGYLEAQGSPTITGGATTTMQTVILLAGDIDGNNVIDQFDAMTIGMNYNLAAPTAADLNNDGTINILDLELLASNYGQSGALAWLPQ